MSGKPASRVGLVEYFDPLTFVQRAESHLVRRETENCHLLSLLPKMIAMHREGRMAGTRYFVLEEQLRGGVMTAAVLFANGCLFVTEPADEQMRTEVVEELIVANAQVRCVYGASGSSAEMARLWASHTGQQLERGRAERVYEVRAVRHKSRATGRLEAATKADGALAVQWLCAFSRETELVHGDIPEMADGLIEGGQLYFWKAPEPVSMAAWGARTPHREAINLVYAPPELRGQGHGAAVVASLIKQELKGDVRACVILSDPANALNDRLYKRIGGKVICEYLQCHLTAAPAGFPRRDGFPATGNSRASALPAASRATS